MKKALPFITLFIYLVAIVLCIVNIVQGNGADLTSIVTFSLCIIGLLVMMYFSTETVIKYKIEKIKLEEAASQSDSLSLTEESTESPSDAEQAVSETFSEEAPNAMAAAFGKSRYTRTFLAKLIQSDDTLKGYYSMIKNAFMSYKKVSSSISREHERIRCGRATIGIMKIRGKTLLLYLALDPKQFDGTMYVGEDVSGVSKYASTPFLYKVNGPRKALRAVRLISMMAENMQLASLDTPANVDYVAMYPYESDAALVKKGLIIENEVDSTESIQITEAPVTEEPVLETEPVVEVEDISAKFGKSRYTHTYTAKLIQSDDVLKGYYSTVKNAFMSYKKVSSSTSREHERIRCGRNTLAIMKVRGKTLLLYLALDPAQFENTMYVGNDVSSVTKYAATPFLYRVNGPRKASRAARLIAMMAEQMGMTAADSPASEDYVAALPYESTKALVKKGLIIDNIKEAERKASEAKLAAEAAEIAAQKAVEDALKAKEHAESVSEKSEKDIDLIEATEEAKL